MKTTASVNLDNLNVKETLPTEPVLKVGTLTGSVAGILSLVVYLAPDLLSDQVLVTIAIASAFALPIITAIFTRGKVWSPAAVQEVVDEAVRRALEAAQAKPMQLRTFVSDQQVEDVKEGWKHSLPDINNSDK